MNLILILLVSFKCILARSPPTLLPNTPNIIKIDVNENESFELHCPVTITSDLSVQWSKNNEELDPLWSTSNLFIRRFLLKIHHAHLIDAGLYKCNVVNGFGYVEAQFQVNVKSNETISNRIVNNEEIPWDINSMDGKAPEFLSRNNDNQTELTKIIQPEGTTVQLKCLASGKPKPDIRWKKNGKILSEDEYGITQNQILNIKDLRLSDTGNYTCEVFNSFGTINTTYILIVIEKLQFFGNDPQNTSVEIGKTAILHCRVQTNDPTAKIQWLKKLNNQQLFRPDAFIFESESYEIIEQSKEEYYSKNIFSKSLIFPQINIKDNGQYICLIQNDKTTNYKKVFINIFDNRKNIITTTTTTNNNNNNILLYVIIIPLISLGFILCIIFSLRCRHRKNLHYNDNLKGSIKPRQPLIQHNGVIIPSTISRTNNDYLADSIDSIPISRQHQQRYGPSTSSDLASLTSSNLYYARVQAI